MYRVYVYVCASQRLNERARPALLYTGLRKARSRWHPPKWRETFCASNLPIARCECCLCAYFEGGISKRCSQTNVSTIYFYVRVHGQQTQRNALLALRCDSLLVRARNTCPNVSLVCISLFSHDYFYFTYFQCQERSPLSTLPSAHCCAPQYLTV